MAPKAKDSKSKCSESCCTQVQNSRVLLMPSGDSGELDVVQLRHPASSKPAYFVFNNTNSKVYELMTFSDKFRCYLVGQSNVMSDGRMYAMTPIDPLFLLLPYLSASVHCCPLEQILRDDEFPQIERLAGCPTLIKSLHNISNIKGVSVLGYKYDEEKTVNWLVEKVNRAARSLISNGVSVATCNSVQSNNYLKHSSSVSSHTHINEDYMRLGLGLVCEYLTSDVRSKLEHKLGLTPHPQHHQATAAATTKRPRTSDPCVNLSDSELVDTKKSKPTPTHLNVKTGGNLDKSSAKQKARAKAAAGTKTISSFFTKSRAN